MESYFLDTFRRDRIGGLVLLGLADQRRSARQARQVDAVVGVADVGMPNDAAGKFLLLL